MNDSGFWGGADGSLWFPTSSASDNTAPVTGGGSSNFLDSILNSGASIFKTWATLQGANKASAAAPAVTNNLSKMVPWIIGGVIAVVALVLITRK